MEKVTSLLQTKTFWASLVSALGWAFMLLGKPLEIDTNAVADILVSVVGGISSLLAIVFRATATTQVTGIVTAPPVEEKK